MAFTIEAKFIHAGNPARPCLVIELNPPQRGFTVHDFILKQVRQWAKQYPSSVSEKSNIVFKFITGSHPDKPQFHVAACEFPQDCGRLFITNDWLKMAELATQQANLANFNIDPEFMKTLGSN